MAEKVSFFSGRQLPEMENGLSKIIKFILSIEGEEMVGIIGKDIISFDNMLEMGVKVILQRMERKQWIRHSI